MEPLRDVGEHARYRFMFVPLEARSRLTESALLSATADLIRAHSLTDITPIGVPCQEEITCIGRIVVDGGGSGDGSRLSRGAIALEGSMRESGGARMALNLDALPGFALYPGQVRCSVEESVHGGNHHIVTKAGW